MSATIDQRIVEMQFNNAQFEKGIQKSLESLDALEKGLKLDSASNGLKKVGKAAESVNFDQMNSGIVAVQRGFNSLEIIGVTALQRITNTAITAGQKLVSALSIDQVAAGWSKYGEMTKAVQTMVAQGNAIESVNEQMDKLNWFTDETSYNFTEMQSNISKFTASGQGLEDSVTAMQGIALWAAKSGQNAATASRAMYQLSQAMGSGVMKREDYRSIVNANMDTDEFRQKALEAAVARGTLKVNADGSYSSLVGNKDAFTKNQFIDKLTDGLWFTSDVMMDVFKEYSSAVDQIYNYTKEHQVTASQAIEELGGSLSEFGLQAFKAGGEARTFEDAIDSVKEAVSSKWMKTFQILFGNAEEATALWTDLSNDLYDIFAESGNERNAYLTKVMGKQSKILEASAWETLNLADDTSAKLQAALKETAKAHGVAVDDITDTNEGFIASLQSGWLTVDILTETLNKYIDTAVADADTLNAKMEEYKKIAKEVIQGDYDNGQARKNALAAAGHDYATIQGIVNKMLAGVDVTVSDLTDAQLQEIGVSGEQVSALRELAKQAEETGTPLHDLIANLDKPSGRELLIDSMRNALYGVMGVLESFKKAWSEAFPAPTAERMYAMLEALNGLSKKLVSSDENAEKFTKSLRCVFDSVGIVTDAFSRVGEVLTKVVIAAFGGASFPILDYTQALGENITAVRKNLKENEALNQATRRITETLVNAVTAVRNWLNEHVRLNEIFTYVADSIGRVIEKTRAWLDEHQAVSKATSAVSKLFTRFVTLSGKATAATSKWFASFNNLKVVQSGLGVLHSIWEKLSDTVIAFAEFAAPKVTKFFDTISEKLDAFTVSGAGEEVSEFSESAQDGFDTVTTKVWSLDGAITALKNNIGGIASNVSGKLEPVKEFLTNVQELMSKGLKGFAFDKLLTAAVGVSVIAAMTKLAEALNGVTKSTASIKDGVVGVLNSVKGVFVAYQKQIQAGTLIKIAAAIAIIAGSLALLAFVPQQQLLSATVVLGTVIGALAALAAGFAYLQGKNFFGETKHGSNGLAGIAIALLAVSASVALIVKTLKSMEGLDLDEAKKNLLLIGGIATILGAVVTAMSRFAGSGAINGVALLAVAVAIKLVVATLNDLANVPMDNLVRTLGKVVVVAGTIGLLTKVAGGSLGAAASIVAVALSLKLVIGVLNDISAMTHEDLAKGLGVMVPIMTMFAVIMAQAKWCGSSAGEGGKALLLMSAALWIVVEVIKNISDIDTADLYKGVMVTGVMMVFMAAFTRVLSMAGGNSVKAGVGLLAMSGAIVILAGAMLIFSKMDEKELQSGVRCIAALEVMFGILMAVSKRAGTGWQSIVAISASVAGLAAVMAMMAQIPSDELKRATIAIDSIMLCLAGLMSTASRAKVEITSIVFLVGTIAAVGGVLYALSSLPDPNAVLPTAEGLSLVIVALSACVRLLGGMSLTEIGSAGFAITAISGIFIALMEAVGWLMNNSETFAKNLDGAAVFVEKLGGIIGGFIGTLAGKIGEGISNSLPQIGKNISDFGTAIMPFVAFASTYTTYTSSRMESLMNGLDKVLNFGVMHGLQELASGSIDYVEVKARLGYLGEGLKALASATNGVSVDRVGASAEALSSVASLLSVMPSTGGMWNEVVGEKQSLSAFGENMKALGDGIREYATSVVGIDPDIVTDSANAAKALAELQNGLPEYGGTLQAWVGSNQTLWDFGENLKVFGAGLVQYSDTITGKTEAGSGVDSKAVTDSANAAQMLVDLENKLPASNGKLQEFLGNTSLGTFGEHLTAFAAGMLAYSEALIKDGGINTAAVTASEAACDMLVALGTKINSVTSGGVASFFTGASDMGTFSDELGSFGEAIAGYSDKAKSFDTGAMNRATDTFSTFLDAVSKLSDTYPGMMESLALTMNHFDTNTAFTELFGNESLKILSDTGDALAEKLINGFAERISGFKETIAGNVRDILESVRSKIESYDFSYRIAVGDLISEVCRVLAVDGTGTGKAFLVHNRVVTLMDDALAAVRGYYTQFEEAGAYLDSGLAIGINNGAAEVVGAVATMTSKALSATRKGLRERSPSKATEEMGKFLDMGLVNGITKFADKVYGAVGDVSIDTLDGFGGIFAKIGQLFDADLSNAPVIRPVIDMDAVDAGLAYINGATARLGGSVLLDASVSARNARLTAPYTPATNQNGARVGDVSNVNAPVTNNFYITGNDPEKIYNYISKRMQRDVDRSRKRWDT